jgi:hypothetical protein
MVQAGITRQPENPSREQVDLATPGERPSSFSDRRLDGECGGDWTATSAELYGCLCHRPTINLPSRLRP